MAHLYYSRSHIPESDTISIDSQSSVSTNATAPNLVGPGRTLGLVIDKAGNWIERRLNRWAVRRARGPHETAECIKAIQRDRSLLVAIPYEWRWYRNRHVEILPMTDEEEKISMSTWSGAETCCGI